ncbi:hypothetical protein DTO195F2_6553 [Paecilomyces variotii]|nr:hypothetical protein DTO195F2_6553 [Paecilomyces variotii]KAJ9369541.1 hypothetical protein DTO282E5_5803 [Paecilomyces variotii]
MEDPVHEISTVIGLLVQSTPALQKQTIERFFTPDAEFTHPFCRTWSWFGSRLLIIKVYQAYKIMSPRIEYEVKSVAFDKEHMKLYVTLSQIFSIWIVPFYVAPVTLTSVLTLTNYPYSSSSDTPETQKEDRKLYYIKSQEDLYQTSEFIKFVVPYGIGFTIVLLWQTFATLFCSVCAVILSPILWLEETGRFPIRRGNIAYDTGRKLPEMRRPL